MSEEATLTCTDCGKVGVIYMIDSEPVCSRCMPKRRPPLAYEGPDRRSRQVATPFLRRTADRNRKKQV